MAPSFRQELVGCFGQPVDENPTQPMVEAAFRHHGLDWRYLTIEVAPPDLGAAVAGARAMGFRGFNCTIPHKLAVIPHLDGLGQSAALMGAVNCVVARDGRLIGENTDGKGFVAGVRRLADPAGKRMVLLGAGGAARAIAVEMALVGARHITVVSRNAAQGRVLVELLRDQVAAVAGDGLSAELAAWSGDYAVPDGTDIVVNATPIGLFPDVNARLGLDVGSLRPGMIAVDVIPNPPRTRFVRDAEARGCVVVDGLAMLVGQGRIGIEYWTGIDPDEAVMRQALEEIFGAGGSP